MNKNIFCKEHDSKIEVTTKMQVMGAENYDRFLSLQEVKIISDAFFMYDTTFGTRLAKCSYYNNYSPSFKIAK
jgi:hypothetical protein